MIRAFGLSDKGRARPVNEDCFAIDEALGLCVVADGIGGHNAGEVAAHLTVDTVVEAVRAAADCSAAADGSEADLLRTAIRLASDRIRDASLFDRHCAGMGTTVVAARIVDDRLSVAYAGDSRLYVLSRGQLRQLTRDDTWLASALAADLDADSVLPEHHPMRHALTNAVGAMHRTLVHVVEETVHAGDVLLLSTDGVHDVVDDWRLEQILLDDDIPRTIVENVLRAARARGSRDNCTVVAARVSGGV